MKASRVPGDARELGDVAIRIRSGLARRRFGPRSVSTAGKIVAPNVPKGGPIDLSAIVDERGSDGRGHSRGVAGRPTTQRPPTMVLAFAACLDRTWLRACALAWRNTNDRSRPPPRHRGRSSSTSAATRRPESAGSIPRVQGDKAPPRSKPRAFVTSAAGERSTSIRRRLTVGAFLDRCRPPGHPPTCRRRRWSVTSSYSPHSPPLGAVALQKPRPAMFSGPLRPPAAREGRPKGQASRPGPSGTSTGPTPRPRARGAMGVGDAERRNACVPSPRRRERNRDRKADAIAPLLARLRGQPIYPIAALALATGMRRGELLALRWGDVDFDRGLVRVERSIESTKAGPPLQEPKTKHGRRADQPTGHRHPAELRAQWRVRQEQSLALGLGKAQAMPW